MSIRGLDSSDITALSSGQVCTDVVSVVKELIENALDAQATSIVVVLDGYGLDQISVQDNGSGIAQEDIASLTKPHFTSKLTSFAEIAKVATYGFRGEALASMADISESFFVTTRTEKESVCSKYGRDSRGCLRFVKAFAGQCGTTITVSKLFAKLPVRRQKFLSAGSSIVAHVKTLIASYAFVHAAVRIQSCVKSPRKGESPVTTTFSRTTDYLSRVLQFFPLLLGFLQHTVHHGGQIELRMLSAKPDTPASALSNKGMFLYVNDRPMTTARGTLKELAKIIRAAQKQCCECRHPFFLLNVICDPASYDLNLEPSKNFVMFMDASQLLECVSSAVQSLYASQVGVSETLDDREHSITSKPMTLMKSTRHLEQCNVDSDTVVQSANVQPLIEDDQELPNGWRFSMFDSLSDNSDTSPTAQHTSDFENGEHMLLEDDYVEEGSIINNPWTIARMNSNNKKRSMIANTHGREEQVVDQPSIDSSSSAILLSSSAGARPVIQGSRMKPRTIRNHCLPSNASNPSHKQKYTQFKLDDHIRPTQVNRPSAESVSKRAKVYHDLSNVYAVGTSNEKEVIAAVSRDRRTRSHMSHSVLKSETTYSTTIIISTSNVSFSVYDEHFGGIENTVNDADVLGLEILHTGTIADGIILFKAYARDGLLLYASQSSLRDSSTDQWRVASQSRVPEKEMVRLW